MTKAELVEKIQAERAPTLSRKHVSRLIDAIFDEIGRAVVASGRFSYPKFGTFVVRRRRARNGRNPRTKDPMTIAATTTIGFRPSPEFRKSVSEQAQDKPESSAA
jgi:nucleoid DNA-binding protein